MAGDELARLAACGQRDSGRLVVVTGPVAGTRYELSEPTTRLGRDPTSDVLLDDVTVSRCHVEIRRIGPAYVAADCGSFNGTYLNGERVEEIMLEDSDELRIGRFTVVFFAPDRRIRS